jgi:hypothetical protein
MKEFKMVQGRFNLGTIFQMKNHSIDGSVQNVQCVQLVQRCSKIRRTINTFKSSNVQAPEIILIQSNQTFTQSYAAK